MKIDKKLFIGVGGAAILGALVFFKDNVPLPAVLLPILVAGIDLFTSWLNGKNNTT